MEWESVVRVVVLVVVFGAIIMVLRNERKRWKKKQAEKEAKKLAQQSSSTGQAASNLISKEAVKMSNEEMCYHHPSQEAVAQCSKCKKDICEDCCDAYGELGNIYAAGSVCHDCAISGVEFDVKMATLFRKKNKVEFAVIIVGIVLGAILGGFVFGSSGGVGTIIVGVLLFGLLGGCGLTVLKAFWLMISGGGDLGSSGNYGGLGKIIRGFGMIIIAPVRTIIKITKGSAQIKEANEIEASGNSAIEYLRAYFAYTQAVEKNEGVDLTSLTAQGGALFENKYAQRVMDGGADAARNGLRQTIELVVNNRAKITDFFPVKK
jgi:hypothetical protein